MADAANLYIAVKGSTYTPHIPQGKISKPTQMKAKTQREISLRTPYIYTNGRKEYIIALPFTNFLAISADISWTNK